MILLDTKICVPQLPAQMVHRHRLLDGMNDALKRKLTLISAPAGSGKTTLLSEWIASRGHRLRVAWLSLGEKENDSYRFWRYFIASLDTIADRQLQDDLKWDSAPTTDELDELIDGINATLPDDFVFVLDDYHVISSSAIHEALTYLLDYLPPQMHLIIASRTRTPLIVAQMRVRNQLLEYPEKDLKFNQNEAGSFVNQMIKTILSTEEISQLTEKTEGWAAGLQMAALSLRDLEPEARHANLQNFSGSHYSLGGYFMEQVLRNLSAENRRFILCTSIFERFNRPLCDAVLNITNAQEVLEQLERDNLFLVRLDDNNEWYRYHHLFSGAMRARLQREFSDAIPDLYHRAADWFRTNQFLLEAIDCALSAKDFELASQLIPQATMQVWNRSEIGTIASWFQSLPPEFIASRLNLSSTIVWLCGITARFQDMEHYLKQVDEILQTRNPSSFIYPDKDVPASHELIWYYSYEGRQAELDSVRVFLLRFQGDYRGAIMHGQRALMHIPPEMVRLRGITMLFLGMAYVVSGDFESASQTLIGAIQTTRTSKHAAAFLNSSHQLAQLRVLQGNLDEALAIYEQASRYVSEQNDPVLVGIECIGIGDLLRERNDLDSAAKNIEEGLRLAEAGGDFMFIKDGYIAKARLEWARGNFEEAEAFFLKAERLMRNSPTCVDVGVIQSWQARLRLAEGNVAAGSRWAKHPRIDPETLPPLFKEFHQITLARILLAEKQTERAESLLEQLLANAKAAGRTGVVIEILILIAQAFLQEHKMNNALESLSLALSIARSQNYICIFVDEGEPVATLLRSLRQEKAFITDDAMREYIDRLLGFFPKAETKSKGKGKKSAQPLIEPLSNRELQVLRLISTGRSYEEVALDLVVALSTVQWHIKNIYQKLNVHSGTEAAAVARELQILS